LWRDRSLRSAAAEDRCSWAWELASRNATNSTPSLVPKAVTAAATATAAGCAGTAAPASDAVVPAPAGTGADVAVDVAADVAAAAESPSEAAPPVAPWWPAECSAKWSMRKGAANERQRASSTRTNGCVLRRSERAKQQASRTSNAQRASTPRR